MGPTEFTMCQRMIIAIVSKQKGMPNSKDNNNNRRSNRVGWILGGE